MTHPPRGDRGSFGSRPELPAPPDRPVPPLPVRPPEQAPALPHPRRPAGAAPAPRPPAVTAATARRRTAFAEGVDRLRSALTTEPGRLRLIGAVLAVLLVAFGAVTVWQVADRSTAASDVAGRSQQLSADAARIHRSLADADTTAAAGFLTGGQWPGSVRERYDGDIARASALLVEAATSTEGPRSARCRPDGSDARQSAPCLVKLLNEQLPVYTGLIEQARANNRQGLPLGGAYLRYANEHMREDLLPAARALYRNETDQLAADYADAESWPWAALAAGALALVALVRVQIRNYRRTNRVFNLGLLTASATAAAVLLWLLVGQFTARSGLDESHDRGTRSLQVLNEARIETLQARADESLTLVARGAVLTEDGKDSYDEKYRARMLRLAGDGTTGQGRTADDVTAGTGPDSLLRRAAVLADDAEGREPVDRAVRSVSEWRERHTDARTSDEGGDYDKALKLVIGEKGTTGESFDEVDAALAAALDHEQGEFEHAAARGRAALHGLAVGAAALALLGAAGAVLGIGRRLSEYR